MKISNNSTYVNATGMQKASYDFYSSSDAEYKLRLENEWYMRIYWQGVETFDYGGYVVFDTFTYDDAHLPRLKDYFSESVLTSTDEDGNEKYFGNYGCFNRAHFPKFMKDLRSSLAYAGYDVNEKVKFVYTTEYGHDDEYVDDRGLKRRGTMRPHYHLMLFVTDPALTPEVLNEHVGRKWTYGFHDNGKSPAKFRRNTFHSGLNDVDRKVRLRGLACYIGKYMHKDADYEKVIGSRIDAIAYSMCPEPSFDTDESRDINEMSAQYKKMMEQGSLTPFDFVKPKSKADEYRLLRTTNVTSPLGSSKKVYSTSFKTREDWLQSWKVCRKRAYDLVGTFHGQSKHFGEHALYDPSFDIDEVAETGKMKMPDQKKVWKFIPIPMYYRRKLFYHQVRKDDGKLMWMLNDDPLSKRFAVNKDYRQAAFVSSIYSGIYKEFSVADRIKVDSWMKGRTLNDLAVYEVFFKDRMFDCDLEGITPADTMEIRMMQDFSSAGLNGNEVNNGQGMKRISQVSRSDFAHFDEVLEVFQPYLEKRHFMLNSVYDRSNELRKSLRDRGIKTKK